MKKPRRPSETGKQPSFRSSLLILILKCAVLSPEWWDLKLQKQLRSGLWHLQCRTVLPDRVAYSCSPHQSLKSTGISKLCWNRIRCASLALCTVCWCKKRCVLCELIPEPFRLLRLHPLGEANIWQRDCIWFTSWPVIADAQCQHHIVCGSFLHNWTLCGSMGSKVTCDVLHTLKLAVQAEVHAKHVVVETCNKPWHSKHQKGPSQRPDAIFFLHSGLRQIECLHLRMFHNHERFHGHEQQHGHPMSSPYLTAGEMPCLTAKRSHWNCHVGHARLWDRDFSCRLPFSLGKNNQ